MINFIYPLLGIRFHPANTIDEKVELCEWSHPVYNPSGHLGIKIQKNGTDFYFSFSPENADGLSAIPVGELRKGRPGHIIRNFDDETLLWGFRNRWGEESISQLSDEQIKKLYEFYIASNRPGQALISLTKSQIAVIRSQMVANEKNIIYKLADDNVSEKTQADLKNIAIGMKGHFKSLSDSQLFTIADMFADKEVKEYLRKSGQPQITALKTCNLDLMINRINELSVSEPRWAPLAGTYFHQPNTYNCASIILDILYAGKMDGLTTSHATRMSYIGLLIGLLSLVKTDDPCWVFASLGVGFIGGRVVGGAYDGYSHIQHFFNMNAGTKHDKFATVIGLRFLATCMGAVMGLMKWGPVIPACLTLPKSVVDLVKEAKDVEEAIYVPSKIRQIGV